MSVKKDTYQECGRETMAYLMDQSPPLYCAPCINIHYIYGCQTKNKAQVCTGRIHIGCPEVPRISIGFSHLVRFN